MVVRLGETVANTPEGWTNHILGKPAGWRNFVGFCGSIPRVKEDFERTWERAGKLEDTVDLEMLIEEVWPVEEQEGAGRKT